MEIACAPVCRDCQFDEDGKWRQPPNGVKLSDELVYLAAKYLPAKQRGNLFPIDFDKNDLVRSLRVPGPPAPLAWGLWPSIGSALTQSSRGLLMSQ